MLVSGADDELCLHAGLGGLVRLHRYGTRRQRSRRSDRIAEARERVERRIEQARKSIPETLFPKLDALGAQLLWFKEQILEFDRLIMAWHLSNETSRRLDAIPGIGPALATALVEKFAKGAKVSIEQARAIALQTRVGVITDEELEHEKGGSGLRYSFDIKSGGTVYEVGVDAQTGKVLETKRKGLTQIEDPHLR